MLSKKVDPKSFVRAIAHESQRQQAGLVNVLDVLSALAEHMGVDDADITRWYDDATAHGLSHTG